MRIVGAALAVAAMIGGGCVDKARWKHQRIYEAYVIAGDAYSERGDPDRALANYNAALKHRDADDELKHKRQNMGRQIAARELARARQLDGTPAIRLAVALRGSTPVGVDVPALVANAIIDRASDAVWPQLVAMAENGQYAAAVTTGRMVAAALPKGNRYEARLVELGRRGAAHHRDMAARAHSSNIRKFHRDLARMLARPLKNLRRNIHETRTDRPNDAVRVRGSGCREVLHAVERHLRKTTNQFAIVSFGAPMCAVRARRRKRRKPIYYWKKVPTGRKQITTILRWEKSGRMGAQTQRCISTNSAGRCTSYATVHTGGGYTYRPIKGKKWVTTYKRVRTQGYRWVDYIEHSAAMVGRARVRIGRQQLAVRISTTAVSDDNRREAIDRAGRRIARTIADASLRVARRVAGQLRNMASRMAPGEQREQQLLAALAVLGSGRDPQIYERYGVDGGIVQDIFRSHPRWPPIGLPKSILLPTVHTTKIERAIDSGKIDTPISLDEDDHRDHVWLSGTMRSSYLLDTERVHELELGWKKTSMEITARLGLSAFGGDGSSFDLRGIMRARGQIFGWFWVMYLGVEIGGDPTDPMVDRGNFAALGGIIGVQAQLWRLRASAYIAPNAFQIFGTGDATGTSRPTPAMAEALLQLPLGLFASAGAGWYLGMPDSGVWQLSAGWRVSFGNKTRR